MVKKESKKVTTKLVKAKITNPLVFGQHKATFKNQNVWILGEDTLGRFVTYNYKKNNFAVINKSEKSKVIFSYNPNLFPSHNPYYRNHALHVTLNSKTVKLLTPGMFLSGVSDFSKKLEKTLKTKYSKVNIIVDILPNIRTEKQDMWMPKALEDIDYKYMRELNRSTHYTITDKIVS